MTSRNNPQRPHRRTRSPQASNPYMHPIDLPRATPSRSDEDPREARSQPRSAHQTDYDSYDDPYVGSYAEQDNDPDESDYGDPYGDAGSYRRTGHGRQAPMPRQRAPRSRYKRRREGRGATIVGLLVVVAIVGGGIWMWLNRTVNVSVNGERTDVRVDSTLEQIVESEGLSLKPGNLVSVGGNVLTEGGGDAFSATVNGEQLDAAGRDAFRAKGNEEIAFGDGADVTEASHEEEREIQPLLEPADSVGSVTFVAQYGKTGKQKFIVGDQSGESVPGDVIEPAQNVKLMSVNPQADDGRKLIALTFDDGPSSYTQQYLDILSKYGIHATFFCLGSAAANNPDLVKAIKDQGSQVASHTMNHKQLTAVDQATLQSEISEAFSAISGAGGGDTSVIRPPYGSFDTSTWLASGGTLSASVIWNLDSLDWELPGADVIVNNCTSGAFSGSIILMHDGGGNRDQDLEALPRIIEQLQGEGYEFVTVAELMASDSRIPAEVAAGNAHIPEGYTWATELAE